MTFMLRKYFLKRTLKALTIKEKWQVELQFLKQWSSKSTVKKMILSIFFPHGAYVSLCACECVYVPMCQCVCVVTLKHDFSIYKEFLKFSKTNHSFKTVEKT
jgi:hypothetical protein